MPYTIYFADDEKNIRNLIQTFLESDGYRVRAFETGDALFKAFLTEAADLVILDIMMPGTDGLSVCRKLRTIADVPIILLTAKDTEPDFIRGISEGSDDYITKPFRPTVLLMRVRALLRRVEMQKNRAAEGTATGLTFGDLRFLPQENEVRCGDTPINFTPTEQKMLHCLLQNPGRAISRNELLRAVWGFDQPVETRVTDETLRRIRKKLTDAGSRVGVRTVWGYGYKLREEEKEAQDK